MKDFSIILAVDNENGIGKCWDLAWKIPEDMKYFKDTTTNTQDVNKQNAVIMGRKTWESIPEKYRPFQNRKNFILSKSSPNNDQSNLWALGYNNLDSCLEYISQQADIESVFIIGGWQLYNQVLDHPHFTKAYITRIYHKFHCDVFFHSLPPIFHLLSRSEMKEHEWIEYEFSVYKKKIPLIEKIKKIFTK